MTPTPDNAVYAALLAALSASAPLSVITGGGPRIYDEPPAGAQTPYVLLGRSQTRPWGGSAPGGATEADGVEHVITVTAVSRFGGTEEARTMTALIRNTLHDAALPLSGWRLVNLRVTFSDVYRTNDFRTTLGVVRLRAVTEGL